MMEIVKMTKGQELIPVSCRITAETDRAVRLGVGLPGQEHLTWVPKSVCSIVGCAGEERVSIMQWWLNLNPVMQLDIHEAVNKLAQNQQKIKNILHRDIEYSEPAIGASSSYADDYYESVYENQCKDDDFTGVL